MYDVYIKPSFRDEISKVKCQKNKDNIYNKIREIAETLELNPNHYKNLRKPLNQCKRVHVNNSFVIVFRVDTQNKSVIFYHYKHHDDIYYSN